MKRTAIANADAEALEAAGFLPEEARWLVENADICLKCPHLMVFHDDQHGDEYPVYCDICDCAQEPPLF
jgi:hypothetical protein